MFFFNVTDFRKHFLVNSIKNVVIYEALCFDVAQGRINRAPMRQYKESN